MISKKKKQITAIHLLSFALILCIGFSGSDVDGACSYKLADYNAAPHFLSASVDPNVLLILDNSGSMIKLANREKKGGVRYNVGGRWTTETAWTGYLPGKKYYGLFNPDKCYQYDNTNHYFYEAGDTVDDPSTEIIERAAGFKGTSDRKFSGNWLNWWTMRRIDVAKKVLTGGKVAPVAYDETNDTLVLEGEWVYLDSASWYDDNYRIFNDYISSDNFGVNEDSDYADPHDILTGEHQKNLFYTPFRRGIVSYFFNEDRGEHFGGTAGAKQFVPMFSVMAADFNETGDLTGSTPASTAFTDPKDNTYKNRLILSDSAGAGPLCVGESDTALRENGYVIAVKVPDAKKNVKGIIQKLQSRVRFGYMHFERGQGSNDGSTDNARDGSWDVDGDSTSDFAYRKADGGVIPNYVGDISTVTDPSGRKVTSIENNINQQIVYMYTPLEEVLWEAVRYFQQKSPSFTASISPVNYRAHFETNNTWDPYYFNHLNGSNSGGFVKCAKSFIIMLSDGASNSNGWEKVSGAWPDGPKNSNLTQNGKGYLDDIAFSAHVSDLRDDTAMNEVKDIIKQNISLYTIFCFDDSDAARCELMKAARAGAFDLIGDSIDPGGKISDSNPANFEGDYKWDKNSDNIPDNYHEAQDGDQLEEKLLKALTDILGRVGSGAAASVSSSTRQGEGAAYQAIFYTESDPEPNSGRKARWYGTVNALFVDQYGYLHEDTDLNDALELDKDKIIVYDADNNRYDRYNFNLQTLALEFDSSAAPEEINYLWDAGSWLGNTALNVDAQRPYGSPGNARYIATDYITTSNPVSNSNVDDSRLMDFIPANFDDAANGNYLFLNSDESGYTDTDRLEEAKQIIAYVRGKEGLSQMVSGEPYRNRSIDLDGDGATDSIYRLGDIIHSAPTAVSSPAESYDLIYKDETYRQFRKRYLNRRTVVYAGANDGMLHAFNGGFIHREPKAGANGTDILYFKKYPQKWDGSQYVDDTAGYAGHDLGAELWAYVPHTVLPHLKWLKELTYGQHVYYVDLKPAVFDANVFTADTDHPGGWGTILVGGMRFGAGSIGVDTTPEDSNDNCDLTFSSAYFALDITNPENEPKLLWSFSNNGMGFSTSYMTPIRVQDKWFVVIGSGPDNYDAVRKSQDGTVMAYGGSNQPAKVFILNAKTGTLEKEFTLPDEDYTFVADPIAMDFDLKTVTAANGLEWSGEAVYFGTDGAGEHKGRIYRIITEGNPLPGTWDLKLLFDTDEPENENDNEQRISVSPSVVMDWDGNFWVYFGTGRFWSTEDKKQPNLIIQNAFYGIKEPMDGNGNFTWGTVEKSNLRNVTGIISKDTSSIGGGLADFTTIAYESWATAPQVENQDQNSPITIEDLEIEIEKKDGWYNDFYDVGERSISRATIFGDIILFTTYVPDEDICGASGYSYLYGLYYKTGTAYKLGVLKDPSNNGTGLGNDGRVLEKIKIGEVLSWTPKIHVDPSTGAIKAMIQNSDGTMKEIETYNPGITRSQVTEWYSFDPSQPNTCVVKQ